MPKDKQPQKEQIKVTDKRIFTAEGEIREEFREQIKPAEPSAQTFDKPAAKPESKAPEPKPAASPQKPAATDHQDHGERRRTMADRGANPGTPFTNFLETLIAQAYMTLGMLPNPYEPRAKPDVGAARQLIDILALLKEKTAGNVTPDEEDFLATHLAELKLAFVKITKNLA